MIGFLGGGLDEIGIALRTFCKRVILTYLYITSYHYSRHVVQSCMFSLVKIISSSVQPPIRRLRYLESQKAPPTPKLYAMSIKYTKHPYTL